MKPQIKKQLGDTAKLKGNSFYGKMIENLLRHVKTMFTDDEKKINAAFRSPFFDDLKEIGDAYEICLIFLTSLLTEEILSFFKWILIAFILQWPLMTSKK